MPFQQPITFAHGGAALDRAQHLRPRAEALLAGPDARMTVVSGGRMLADLGAGTPRLGWLEPTAEHLAESAETPVFLGLIDARPHFATTWLAREGDGPDPRLPAAMKFIDLRSIAGQLTPGEATVAATAKGVLGWHDTHTRCARCGGHTALEDGGWRRRCTACAALHFPRTDPVVIMLVTHGDRCLIGRQSVWPPGLYSCLAGFMEPGETFEDAVRREVMEESGIRIGRVRYVACQPWPFPSSLMIGCHAEALSDEITRDPAEIEDALWVGRADVAHMLDGTHPRFGSPRVDAIARALLTGWVTGEIEAF